MVPPWGSGGAERPDPGEEVRGLAQQGSLRLPARWLGEQSLPDAEAVLDARVTIGGRVVEGLDGGGEVAVQVRGSGTAAFLVKAGLADALPEQFHDPASERDVPGLVLVVQAVEVADRRVQPLVARHAHVVVVDDLLEDEDAREDQEVL